MAGPGRDPVPGPAADRVTAAALATCDRIDRLDPPIRAFVAEPDRRARLGAAAAEVSARWPDEAGRPVLFGVPVGVKDVIRVDGLPTRAGSLLPADVLAGGQADVVTSVRAAGALVAGKTVTAEFAGFAPGPTRNPRGHDHTPGGSSSGSAAAVAAGMVRFALGTQTVGSVIRPAAYCGVAGFRPTHGRVPSAGVIAFAPSLDAVGWFAPDASGLARLAAALLPDTRSGDDRPGPGAGSAARPALGVPVGRYLELASADALAAFTARVAALRAAGFAVREVPVLDDADSVLRTLHVISRHEIARSHEQWFPRYGGLYRPQTVAAIRDGQAISAAEYDRALRAQQDLGRRLAEVMATGRVDVWITPAATGPAPASLDSTGDPAMSVPWSLAGLPALSLPAGQVGGMPVGMQCVGRRGGDWALLAAAVPIERALSGDAA
jgi:Asp-tRNA(Asn)/Glu-tRNA(Gln) amidotransferase A subunit family amidase